MTRYAHQYRNKPPQSCFFFYHETIGHFLDLGMITLTAIKMLGVVPFGLSQAYKCTEFTQSHPKRLEIGRDFIGLFIDLSPSSVSRNEVL